jgi:hypothetical protein
MDQRIGEGAPPFPEYGGQRPEKQRCPPSISELAGLVDPCVSMGLIDSARGEFKGSDPFVSQALEDQDEQVQARALELIVQDWARAQAARSEAAP